MTRFAFGAKCGCFGRERVAPAGCGRPRRAARDRMPGNSSEPPTSGAEDVAAVTACGSETVHRSRRAQSTYTNSLLRNSARDQALPRLRVELLVGDAAGLQLLAHLRQVLRRRRPFLARRRPAERAAGTPARSRLASSGRSRQQPGRELLRLRVDERVVHQEQRLQRRRAGRSRAAVLALVSAPSNRARNGCRWMRCVIR